MEDTFLKDEAVKKSEQALLESFRRGKKNRLKTLLGMYRGQYFKLFLSVFMYALKHLPVWALPIITANIINIATKPDENAFRDIMINVAVEIVLVLQNILTNYFHTSLRSKVIRTLECSLRGAMVRKLQQLSISFHNEMQSGRIQSKIMRDVEQVETLSTQLFIQVLSIIMNIAVSMTVVINTSFTVFGFFLAAIPVAAIIMAAFRKKIRDRNREFRKEMEETSARVMEMAELVPVTRAHALENYESERMSKQLKEVAHKGYKLDVIQSFFGSISWASFQIFQIVCLGFTGYLAAQGKILPGDVVMYQTYFGSIVNQISSIIALMPIISKGLESVDSIGDIMLSDDVEDTSKKRKIKTVKGDVEFKDVCFRYRKTEKDVLNGLSFEVKSGETIALVGASGAGKTTVLNLLIGFIRANSGKILIDGQDLGELDLQSVRQHIAVVPQQPILFTGTIRDNITYGSENVSDEFLSEVVEAANLTELIEELPKGLDTIISEHGSNLSGGQRQRVSIARAFVRNPKILILDEATSALDSISEKKIQDSIDRLVKDRTTFIVAHRLSTIKNADKIAVLRDGEVAEMGSFEELMEKKGEFYKLRQMQL